MMGFFALIKQWNWRCVFPIISLLNVHIIAGQTGQLLTRSIMTGWLFGGRWTCLCNQLVLVGQDNIVATWWSLPSHKIIMAMTNMMSIINIIFAIVNIVLIWDWRLQEYFYTSDKFKRKGPRAEQTVGQGWQNLKSFVFVICYTN